MKKLAADLSLDKDMLEAVTEKTGVARRERNAEVRWLPVGNSFLRAAIHKNCGPRS